MLPWLPFETTDGAVSMASSAQGHRIVHCHRTVEEYRQVAPIAAAQGLGVVNGGYTYDNELVGRLPLGAARHDCRRTRDGYRPRPPG